MPACLYELFALETHQNAFFRIWGRFSALYFFESKYTRFVLFYIHHKPQSLPGSQLFHSAFFVIHDIIFIIQPFFAIFPHNLTLYFGCFFLHNLLYFFQ